MNRKIFVTALACGLLSACGGHTDQKLANLSPEATFREFLKTVAVEDSYGSGKIRQFFTNDGGAEKNRQELIFKMTKVVLTHHAVEPEIQPGPINGDLASIQYQFPRQSKIKVNMVRDNSVWKMTGHVEIEPIALATPTPAM